MKKNLSEKGFSLLISSLIEMTEQASPDENKAISAVLGLLERLAIEKESLLALLELEDSTKIH